MKQRKRGNGGWGDLKSSDSALIYTLAMPTQWDRGDGVFEII